MAQRASRGSGGSKGRFLLEAHYYDGGLRVRPLGSAAVRPPWVPPSDHVGFRNEIPLSDDDAVVEFARFSFEKQRVTWIGVFKRSVDQVFGDRQNHAGVGVWLLEADVADTANLLISLAGLAAEIAAGKVEAMARHADAFSRQEYLPSYLRMSGALPGQLGGWPYSAARVPETALFAAFGQDADKAWEAAAEQLLRMSILPGPGASRALILVRSGRGADLNMLDAPGLQPVKRGFVAELVSSLPAAIDDVAQRNRELEAGAAALRDEVKGATDSLARERESAASLNRQIAELKKQISDHEELRKLTRIVSSIATIEERVTSLDRTYAQIRNKIDRTPSDGGNHFSKNTKTIHIDDGQDEEPGGTSLFWKPLSTDPNQYVPVYRRLRGDRLGRIIVIFLVLVAIALTVWLLLFRDAPGPTVPSLDVSSGRSGF